jgi:hypothetical protein
MKDGLYKVNFATPIGQGGGVIVLSDSSIRGGDGTIYYVGTFSESGADVSANVDFNFHTKWPGAQSVFGIDRGSIVLTGNSTGDSAQLTGTSPQAPGVTFQCTLSRICD